MNIRDLPYRVKPYDHQLVGVSKLYESVEPELGRIYPGCVGLFDEMGAGKTKQTIDAVQALFHDKQIWRAVVICPAAVRSVWFDPEWGELKKHLWDSTPARIIEYHAKVREWHHGPDARPRLEWIITNYDYVRVTKGRESSKLRLKKLLSFVGPHTYLILDEATAVKNHRSAQTKACIKIRRQAGRVVLLDGTPVANSPADMYAKGLLMDSRILNCPTWVHFRSMFGIVGGYMNRQIIGWQNLEHLQKAFAPYVLRRLKKDCIDLPEKLPPVTLTVPLTETTWAAYKEMRDEMITWLDTSAASLAPVAITKVMRLAQITSGFVGGVIKMDDQDIPEEDDELPDWLPGLRRPSPVEDDLTRIPNRFEPVREVGREKLDLFLSWLDTQLEEDPNLHLLVWCRFRPELDRLLQAVAHHDGGLWIGGLHGGQKRDDRDKVLRLLDPRTTPKGPTIVAGTLGTGGLGINASAMRVSLYMSNDYSLMKRKQSEDRPHRPGQVNVTSFYDVVATGPHGQKTIDHTIVKALRDKNNLAEFTMSAWVNALREE